MADSKRQKRNQLYRIEDCESYITLPSYMGCDDVGCGGRHSSAILGPNCLLSTNSDADPSLPTSIIAARAKYDHVFKAGHLLNAQFGGDGKNRENLMILTSSANVQFNAFDNCVKNALNELKHIYEFLCKNYVNMKLITLGIKVDITASHDMWGASMPEKHIHKGATLSAKIVNEFILENQKKSSGETIEFTKNSVNEYERLYDNFKYQLFRNEETSKTVLINNLQGEIKLKT